MSDLPDSLRQPRRFARILAKILLYGAAGLVVVVVLALAYVFIRYPKKEPPPDVAIERTPERLERGRYLMEHVAMCLNCHSERMWQYYSAPVDTATMGAGTYVTLYGALEAHSANITPFGLGDWTDGEVIRVITAGIRRDGTAVHPLMPFDTYAMMPREDVYAVVAYLRTLEPIERTPSENDLNPLFKIVSRLLPKPWMPPEPVDPSDRVAYGAYLVELAECKLCHGSSLAGGRTFEVPGDGEILASNITPSSTGIGDWSRENFIGVFKSFASPESQRILVPEGEPNTVMPWVQYARLSEEDLGAIYDYLSTFEPVEE